MATRHDILKGSREKKRKRKLFRVWSLLFVIVVLLIVIVVAARSDRLLIGDISISGNRIIPEEVIGAEVVKIIDGNYLLLFPRKNILIYPKSEIKEEIESSFPRIENVSINLSDLKNLSIKIKEREPAFLWCVLDNVCRFMDENGVVFSDEIGLSGDVFIKIVARDMVVDLGERALDKEEVFLLQSVIKILPDILGASALSGSSLTEIEILKEGDYKFALREKGGENSWELLINFDGDISRLLDNLISVVTSEVFATDYEEQGALDYLDVRFGRKVFYKFK